MAVVISGGSTPRQTGVTLSFWQQDGKLDNIVIGVITADREAISIA